MGIREYLMPSDKEIYKDVIMKITEEFL